MRGHQDTSLDKLLEATILEKVERVAEALASKEVMNAREAADFLRISESEFNRIESKLPQHAITERRYIYLRSALRATLHSGGNPDARSTTYPRVFMPPLI